SANNWVCHLIDMDRRLQTSRHSGIFQSALQSQTVNHSSQHSHVVTLHTIHTIACSCNAPENVSPTDDDRHFHTFFDNGFDVLCIFCQTMGVNTILAFAHECFTVQFEDDSFVFHVLFESLTNINNIFF